MRQAFTELSSGFLSRRKEVRPVPEFLMTIVAIMIAVPIAKQFVNDIQKEIAAHDDSSIKGDKDDNR